MGAASNYNLGLRLYRCGRYDEAVSILSALAGESGLLGRLAKYYQARACHQAGLDLARAGNFQAAQEYFRRTMSLVGPNADLSSYLARLYGQAGQHERAEALLSCSSDLHTCPRAMVDLALAQHRTGRPAMAIMTLRDALRHHAQSPELHMHLGMLLAREEQFAEAKGHFQQAADLDCLCADAWRNLALCDAAEGNLSQAIRNMERASLLQPYDVAMAHQLSMLARALTEQGRVVHLHLCDPAGPATGSMLRQLADFVARESDFITAFLALPESPVDGELFGLLSAVLETALELHPDYADLHLRQSRVWQRLDQTRPALWHAHRAVEINPKYVQAHIQLGRLMSAENPGKALVHFRQAVLAGGNYADIWSAIGLLHEQLGEKDQACDALHNALKINEGFRQADEALKRLAA